jgi:hypothetical protein
MDNWFGNVKDCDTLKKRYRKMALELHPDRLTYNKFKNANDPLVVKRKETFQAFQNRYNALLRALRCVNNTLINRSPTPRAQQQRTPPPTRQQRTPPPTQQQRTPPRDYVFESLMFKKYNGGPLPPKVNFSHFDWWRKKAKKPEEARKAAEEARKAAEEAEKARWAAEEARRAEIRRWANKLRNNRPTVFKPGNARPSLFYTSRPDIKLTDNTSSHWFARPTEQSRKRSRLNNNTTTPPRRRTRW